MILNNDSPEWAACKGSGLAQQKPGEFFTSFREKKIFARGVSSATCNENNLFL